LYWSTLHGWGVQVKQANDLWANE